MTCIIGLEHDGKVYMGGDSASNGGWETRVHVHSKVWRTQYLLIGISGSHRAGQVVRLNLERHLPEGQTPSPANAYRFALEYVVPAFQAVMKECNLTEKAEREENFPSGGFLIGCAGHLYTLWSNFALTEFAEGYTAIGQGEPYALGAMAALSDLPPKKRIKRALKIAGQFCNGVCGPYYVMEL